MWKKAAAAAAVTLALAGTLSAQTVEERLSDLENRVTTLESKVAWLETFHPAPREFTVTQSTLTFDDFNSKLAALGLQEGEWLYLKASGDINRDGIIETDESMEMCTTDDRFIRLIWLYFNDDNLMDSNFFNLSTSDNKTFVKTNYGPGIGEWGSASQIKGNTFKGSRILFEAYGANRWFMTDIFPNEPLINFNTDDPNNTVTFKAGATRQEACGF